MRLPLLVATLLIALAGCDDRSSPVATSIDRPYIRLAAVPGQPAAGYAILAATPDRGALTGVSSPRAGHIEMHETAAAGSMASMRHVQRIDLAENPKILFAPGGRHLMLFDVDPDLKPGDRAELTFHFERGEPATTGAAVIAAGDDIPH
jgi:periplasmic copper chaperone A